MSIDKINDLRLHNGSIREELSAAVARVIASGWFILGPEVEAFEEEFAAYCGVPHCISVGNGTDALELAMRGVGVQAGGEVITVANAGMYSTTAILAIGGVPVYADIDEASHNLSIDAAELLITDKTQAIVVTHLYGKMANMVEFRRLADLHGLALIEDCAQSCGATLEGKRAGAWGDAAAFSFYPTKNLGALGDGGAVTTVNGIVADRVRSLRQYGWGGKYQVHLRGGRNSRLDEMQAAVLRVKLSMLDGWSERRRNIAQRYHSNISNAEIRFAQETGSDYVAHLFVVCSDSRDVFREFLSTKGIASDVHYPLLDHQQQIFDDGFFARSGDLPVSTRLVGQVLTVPCYPELLDSEIDQICEAINSCSP